MSPESRRRHISFVYQDQRLYNSSQTGEEKHSQVPTTKSFVTCLHAHVSQDDILGATLTVREATWIQP